MSRVADVTLGTGGWSRLDMLEARPAPSSPAPPWDRKFVAFDGSGYLTLEMAWDKSGPVPFRWLGSGRQATLGDSLASAFYNNGSPGIDSDEGIDPLDPRPRNLLETTDDGTPFLDPQKARVEVVAFDTIDGLEVVRIAWISNNANNGVRGICWLAPSLGYATVASNATMDPIPDVSDSRKSWRKRSSDFVKVANLWLPRKVTYEESEIGPAGGEPVGRHERQITIEDPRVEPTLPADTFHPKLAIQALDDLSGNFTAKPPELPAGLVDRLKRAVRESPFGPPGVEKTVEQPTGRRDAGECRASPNSPASPADQQGPASPAKQPSGKPGEQSGKPGEQPSNKTGEPQSGKPSQGQGAEKPSSGAKPGDPAEIPSRIRSYGDIVTNVDKVTRRGAWPDARHRRRPPSRRPERWTATDPRSRRPQGSSSPASPATPPRPTPGSSPGPTSASPTPSRRSTPR